jgi:hypothetical protein
MCGYLLDMKSAAVWAKPLMEKVNAAARKRRHGREIFSDR